MKMKKAIRMPLRRTPRSRPASSLRARATTVDDAYEEEDYGAEDEPNMKFSHALMVVLALHLIAVGGVFAFNWMKARQTPPARPAASATTAQAPATAQASATTRPAATTGPAKPAAAASAAAKPAEAWTGRTHTVKAGDTLTRIADLYQTTIAAVEEANGITTYSMIRVGQVLRIPGAPAKSASDAATKKAFLAAKAEAPREEAPKAAAIAAVPHAPAPAETRPAQAVEKPAVEAPPAGVQGDVYIVAKGENPYTIAKKLHVSYKELLDVNHIEDPTKIQIGQKLKIPKK